MELGLLNHTKDRVPGLLLKRWLKACEKQLFKRDQKLLFEKEILIVFVSSKQMKKLNHQFRGKDYATDILSFESLEPGSIGELVLSPQVVRAQAKRTGLSYHQELCYMILHGLLHLLGYDHETSKKEAKKMFELQNRIFDHLAPSFDFR